MTIRSCVIGSGLGPRQLNYSVPSLSSSCLVRGEVSETSAILPGPRLWKGREKKNSMAMGITTI